MERYSQSAFTGTVFDSMVFLTDEIPFSVQKFFFGVKTLILGSAAIAASTGGVISSDAKK